MIHYFFWCQFISFGVFCWCDAFELDFLFIHSHFSQGILGCQVFRCSGSDRCWSCHLQIGFRSQVLRLWLLHSIPNLDSWQKETSASTCSLSHDRYSTVCFPFIFAQGKHLAKYKQCCFLANGKESLARPIFDVSPDKPLHFEFSCMPPPYQIPS